MTQILYIMCGYSFAGKTTIANYLSKQFGFVRVSVDDINTEREVGLNTKVQITQGEWNKTYEIFYSLIRKNLSQGRSVIADSAGYSRIEREKLRDIAKKECVKSKVVFIDAPIEIVRKRWQKNNIKSNRNKVRKDNFENVIEEFETPGKDESVICIPYRIPLEELNQLFK